METKIILEKSEVKEMLYSGLSKQLENYPSIEIEDFSQDKYGSFYLSLSGDEDDIKKYLSFFGYV